MEGASCWLHLRALSDPPPAALPTPPLPPGPPLPLAPGGGAASAAALASKRSSSGSGGGGGAGASLLSQLLRHLQARLGTDQLYVASGWSRLAAVGGPAAAGGGGGGGGGGARGATAAVVEAGRGGAQELWVLVEGRVLEAAMAVVLGVCQAVPSPA